ncbi:variant surface glycoprotein (VSG), putative [Trypanosoma vivax Y486]|uniref:Variant surface glycoprotein (VSG), putative n=1 Tax=Trypanosoma vivax (strain Y486) TaxID=1055687 RepID=F9WNS3_TRYVY|nr:variant surface glycoprotein (VSG), putative [Trypanosoma vivax Y486]|eukprot:CCD19194.1 variant surface glycoprotein (VSG), putative [Trypanosoma vivax Y486]
MKKARETVTEAEKNAALLAAKMLEKGTWSTSAILAHAVTLAVRAAKDWKQVAPLMDTAKRADIKGLYGHINESADNISTLNESMVTWNISANPKEQAIGVDKAGSGQFTRASGQALAADITCLCPSAAQGNECIKIQEEGTVIDSDVKDKPTAVTACIALKNYCIAEIRGQATKGSILASIAQLKAYLGTNTGATTTGTNIKHITHALGQQENTTSDKQDIKFVTYGAYARGKIPWEQALIEASAAIDKARRLAEDAETAADLALGLVTTWAPVQRNESEQAHRRAERETDATEQQRDKEKTKESRKENASHRTQQECTQTGGTWIEGRCQSTAQDAESADADTGNAHTIQHAMRAGMMLAALVVKTTA